MGRVVEAGWVLEMERQVNWQQCFDLTPQSVQGKFYHLRTLKYLYKFHISVFKRKGVHQDEVQYYSIRKYS